MENQITCPKCGKTITGDPLIAAAVTGKGESSQFITCECGEKITFWGITAQLRDQKKLGRRLGNWFQRLFKGQS